MSGHRVDPADDESDADAVSGSGDHLGKTHDKSMDNDDDEFEFEQLQLDKKKVPSGSGPATSGSSGGVGGSATNSTRKAGSSGSSAAMKVSDRPYDEAVEVSDSNEDVDSVSSANGSPEPRSKKQSKDKSNPKSSQHRGKKGPSDGDEPDENESNDLEDEDEQSGDSHIAAKPRAGAAGGKKRNGGLPPNDREDEEGGGNTEENTTAGAGSGEPKASQAKLYNPADYAHLSVSSEIQSLFDYIGRYKPTDIDLDTKMKPFIPDYIPAVGEIDAFLKIPPPDPTGTADDLSSISAVSEQLQLGLSVLDEPSAHQSDPTVLDLQLRVVSKQVNLAPVTVRSIENADKNPKKISKWIASIEEVHRQKPPAAVEYSQTMPDIETLMQAWMPEFEEMVKNATMPTEQIDVSVHEFSRIVCAIMEIPVYEKITESMHVLFTLYSEFKNNSHFQH